ncbi:MULTISPECIES: hypothetical protein [unclassified Campylobacter]|uniref:hypothetical protein n=1 Tax=unclassified Campylobacter TaxID=2593542 RepID=UPI001475581A|nr:MULTISPECIES: hypothetical protein [unclassified Campylobacter]
MPLPLIPVLVGGASLAAAAFGAKKGYDAYSDTQHAKNYNERARNIFEESQKNLNTSREATNTSIVKLGEYKKEVFDMYMIDFIEIFSRIKNYEPEGGLKFDSAMDISSKEFEELKSQILDIRTAFGGAAALGAGAAAGFGAFGLTGALATASTGTAISSLSGVAATNATLAWLGGGSLATGGLGMAGGTMVLGGLVAGPALAVAGWVLSSKAETAKNNAYSNLQEAKSIAEANQTAILELSHVKDVANTVKITLSELSEKYFSKFLSELENIVSINNNYASYSKEDQRLVHNTVLLAQSIKNLISVPLLEENGKISVAIRKTKRKAEKLLKQLKDINEKYN